MLIIIVSNLIVRIQLETVKALKIYFLETNKKTYNPEFVSKVLESKEQANIGKVTKKEKDN